MRIVISEFISLDGVVQAPGGPDEDRDGGFRHGGWSMKYFDPEVMGAAIGEMAASTEALLQGRRTFQVMAAAWPERAGDSFADWMNSIQKYVVSGTLTDADLTWRPTTVIRPADLVKDVSALRARDGGDVNVMGSATLARALLAADLVDELSLLVHPIIVGKGERLFPENAAPLPLCLATSATFTTGVIHAHYTRP
jgi:dihydrofolate reductase